MNFWIHDEKEDRSKVKDVTDIGEGSMLDGRNFENFYALKFRCSSENDKRTKETSFLFPNPAYLERGREMASAIIAAHRFSL